MTTKPRTGILLLALLLSACGTGQPLEKPAAPEAAAYTATDELVSPNQRVKLGDRLASEWWTLFSSKPLNELIHKTVENNYGLAAAKETLAQAKEAVNAENGALMPQVSLGAAAGRQKYGVALFGPAQFSIPPFTYYEVGPSISWTPDLFGRERHALERQQALADYQLHQLDAAYISLAGNTVTAALEWTAATAEAAAAKRILAEDEKTLALMQTSFDLGAAAKADVLDAQARLFADRALLPPLEQRAAAGRHALSILAGQAPADWVAPKLEFADFTLPQELPVSLPSELVRNRPDILAAEANLRAASAAANVAAADFYPSVTLTANMLQEALTPAGIFRSASNAWALAAAWSLPVYTGGALAAEKRGAEHAYQAALAQYRQTVLDAFGDVADTLTALDRDDEAVAAARAATDTAVSMLDVAQVSYENGAVGLLQIQDAQRALAQTQLDLIRTQHQRYLDCVKLFVALGGSPVAGKT